MVDLFVVIVLKNVSLLLLRGGVKCDFCDVLVVIFLVKVMSLVMIFVVVSC